MMRRKNFKSAAASGVACFAAVSRRFVAQVSQPGPLNDLLQGKIGSQKASQSERSQLHNVLTDHDPDQGGTVFTRKAGGGGSGSRGGEEGAELGGGGSKSDLLKLMFKRSETKRSSSSSSESKGDAGSMETEEERKKEQKEALWQMHGLETNHPNRMYVEDNYLVKQVKVMESLTGNIINEGVVNHLERIQRKIDKGREEDGASHKQSMYAGQRALRAMKDADNPDAMKMLDEERAKVLLEYDGPLRNARQGQDNEALKKLAVEPDNHDAQVIRLRDILESPRPVTETQVQVVFAALQRMPATDPVVMLLWAHAYRRVKHAQHAYNCALTSFFQEERGGGSVEAIKIAVEMALFKKNTNMLANAISKTVMRKSHLNSVVSFACDLIRFYGMQELHESICEGETAMQIQAMYDMVLNAMLIADEVRRHRPETEWSTEALYRVPARDRLVERKLPEHVQQRLLDKQSSAAAAAKNYGRLIGDGSSNSSTTTTTQQQQDEEGGGATAQKQQQKRPAQEIQQFEDPSNGQQQQQDAFDRSQWQSQEDPYCGVRTHAFFHYTMKQIEDMIMALREAVMARKVRRENKDQRMSLDDNAEAEELKTIRAFKEGTNYCVAVCRSLLNLNISTVFAEGDQRVKALLELLILCKQYRCLMAGDNTRLKNALSLFFTMERIHDKRILKLINSSTEPFSYIVEFPDGQKYDVLDEYMVCLRNYYTSMAFNDAREAAIRIRRILPRYPEEVKLWVALGWAHHRQGDFNLACYDCLRAMELEPESNDVAQLKERLGHILKEIQDMKDFRAYIETFKQKHREEMRAYETPSDFKMVNKKNKAFELLEQKEATGDLFKRMFMEVSPQYGTTDEAKKKREAFWDSHLGETHLREAGGSPQESAARSYSYDNVEGKKKIDDTAWASRKGLGDKIEAVFKNQRRLSKELEDVNDPELAHRLGYMQVMVRDHLEYQLDQVIETPDPERVRPEAMFGAIQRSTSPLQISMAGVVRNYPTELPESITKKPTE